MPVKYYVEEMEIFWRFIAERHSIYKKKEIEKLPPPWTDDPILSSFKFTNVVRSTDPGTRYVIDKILKWNLCELDILLNVIAYRIFNKIETIEKLGQLTVQTYNSKQVLKKLEQIEKEQKVFTNAFVVSGYSQFGSGMPKIERVSLLLGQVVNQITNDYNTGYNHDIWQSESMEPTYNYLLSINGIGPFLGYQIAVDLSYWDQTKFGEDEFVIDGPGARRGLEELFPMEEIKEHGYEWLNFWLRDKQVEFWEDYGIDYKKLFDDQPTPLLTVMSLENTLCEGFKMFKALRENGRPRNKYNPQERYEFRLNEEKENDTTTNN